jgi:hypothetical protein
MARFTLNLPTKELEEFKKIYGDVDEIFGEMTRAGAEVALKEMLANCPNPELRKYGKLTRTYKTPSDGGINTKAYFSGYIPFSNPNRKYFSRKGGNGSTYSTTKGVPADFLAKIYEYGRSGLPFPKKPFVRKSFDKGKIEKAMLEAQKKASGGLLDE